MAVTSFTLSYLKKLVARVKYFFPLFLLFCAKYVANLASLMFRKLVCFTCADTMAGFLLPITWSKLIILMCIISVREGW